MFLQTFAHRKRILHFVTLLTVSALIFSFARQTLAADFTPPCADSAALIAAITTANANAEADTINLAAGCTYTLTAVNNLSGGGNGLPVITSQITINGNGATIARSSGAPSFRLFGVASSANLSLNNVTISGGGGTDGGGIYNDGTLALTNSIVSGNSATNGGGIYNDGTLNLTNSTVSGNTSSNYAGGIFNDESRTATIINSTITGNNAAGSGAGGIYNAGTLTITNSTLSSNQATLSIGGGLFNQNTGTATLTNSILSNNSASDKGGGIYNVGALTLTNSTLSANSAPSEGGGITNHGTATLNNNIVANSTSGGDCYRSSGTVTTSHSLVESGGCSVTNGVNGNRTGVDPALNGDLTLSASSPAVNAGSNALVPGGVTTDRAGNARVQGGTVDMGAYESAFLPPNLSINDVSQTEGNSGTTTFSFTVSLSSPAQAGGVTFDIAAADGTASTADNDYVANTLTGQSISQGNSSYTFNVAVNGDFFDENTESFFVNISNVTGATLTDSQGLGTINDDDSAGIVVSPTSGLTTTEAGGTANFTISLTSQPRADVTIGLTSSDATEGSVPASAVLNASNWQSGVSVTVTGVDDDVVDGNVSYTIYTDAASSSDGLYSGINPDDVSVTNTDDDSVGITVGPTGGLITTEAGGTATFTVVLTSQPTADVTIGISSSDTTEGTVNLTSLTFTSGNWNIPQTVNVTGVDDDLADGSVAYTVVTAAATGGDYAGIDADDVSVTNTDDDTAGITVNPTGGLITTEAGGTATFTVVLNSEPTADVTIGVSSSDTTEGTVNLSSLTFTTANWNIPQTVTVTGVDDDIADGDTAYTILTAAATGGDYAGIDADDVSVTNIDDDTAGITVSPTSGLITTEAGGTATFTVVLNSEPTADVTIGVSSSDTTEGTVDLSSLTFTIANWNVAQTVTVTGVDDAFADSDVAFGISFVITSSDPDYAGVVLPDVTVTNTDDDRAGVTIAPTQLPGRENETYSYTIQTSSPPTGMITIEASFDPAYLELNGSSVSPITLTFSDATPQTVSVHIVQNDNDDANRTTTITHSISTSAAVEYAAGTELATVTVSIEDLPPPPPVPMCEGHNFDEGGVVRSSTADAFGYAVNCRVMYQNGSPTTWFGADLYGAGNIGIQGVMDLGVQQAIDIFSPSGMTYFEGGAVFCLRGSGTLIWMAAANQPRQAEIIGSYTVPEWPGFTCATLFEPGTLVLVSRNPVG